jgi:hypothetical protein
MGGKVTSGNYAHDLACSIAEGIRQSAVIGVASSPAGQAVMNAAEIQYNRSCIASCRTNNGGNGAEAFVSALRALGTGGV